MTIRKDLLQSLALVLILLRRDNAITTAKMSSNTTDGVALQDFPSGGPPIVYAENMFGGAGALVPTVGDAPWRDLTNRGTCLEAYRSWQDEVCYLPADSTLADSTLADTTPASASKKLALLATRISREIVPFSTRHNSPPSMTKADLRKATPQQLHVWIQMCRRLDAEGFPREFSWSVVRRWMEFCDDIAEEVQARFHHLEGEVREEFAAIVIFGA